MYEDNKKTVVDDGNPWAQDEDNRPTVVGGQTADMTPAGDAARAQPTPFQQIYPQPRPTPPPNAPPAQPAYTPPPQPATGAGGSKTVIMHTQQEDIPLAWLAIVEGVGGTRGTVYTLQRETMVGRTSGSIVLPDPAISGQHLKVRLEPSEQDPKVEHFVLYDMASANGTFVGNYEACKKEANRVYRHILEDGDYIQIGKTMLIFKQV